MSLTNDTGHARTLSPWAQGIASRMESFSPDEKRVIERIVQGIERGRDVYGPMDLASDRRELEAEAADEARDWLVYRAMIACSEKAGR
jgi:hypothetical protein